MKYLCNFDLCQNELQNAVLQNLATAPNNPKMGQIFFDSANSKFYGYNGTAWIDLGQVLTGASIVSLINASSSILDDNNLSAAAQDAIGKRHSHANATVLNAMEQAFTTALKNKLDGISANATKVEKSNTNGNIKVNGSEVNVYTHPGSGSNPHGTTKADLGLSNVENKSAATILNELTKSNINKALGFIPRDVRIGLESAKGTATGSQIVYIATDSKKIWLDYASGSWVQIGGQDTLDWSNITNKPSTFPPATHRHDDLYLGKTAKAESAKVADNVAWGNVGGKPSTFTPPVASSSVLGGIKVGANLSIDSNGVLAANDNPTSYIVKQQEFIATKGQRVFTLTNGKYRPGIGAISVFLNGVKMINTLFTETSETVITLKLGVDSGDRVLLEYIELINVTPYPVHSTEHLTGGTDAIPLATASKDGLMPSVMFSKLTGLYTNAQIDAAISRAINGLMNGAPGALDTLKELADAMGNDPNFSATLTNKIATKVDKVTGKGLSTEDFTTPLLNKLNGIAAGANAYVHPSTHPATMIVEDATHRFATDTEKSSWNSRTRKYSATIGNGSLTTIPVTHSLNTMDIDITVREAASPYNVVYTDIQIVDANRINLLFAVAPTSNQFRVTVVG
ncbi:hypothetical protein [Clostridium cadaveris]|uniref:hypothetical protein n=1 Tax=Clostridium cadaveris TaxID=1529 RepID=UPI0015B6F6A0|nr:hypothetical protein [Clostridium cadaveris]NWK11312.1 hypothetical protein [Clostridium cadaveris]